MISTLQGGKKRPNILLCIEDENNQLILCTIKEYKIQYILIENTTIIFEAIILFDKENIKSGKSLSKAKEIKYVWMGFNKQALYINKKRR